jgi:integrase
MAGSIENFTESKILKWVKAGGGTSKSAVVYRDTAVTGLIFMVRARVAVYGFEAKMGGKTRRRTIGDHKTHSLDAARIEARRLKGLVDLGQDPTLEKIAQIKQTQRELVAIKAGELAEKLEEQKAMVLTREAWNAYLLAHQGEWGHRHYRDHINLSQDGGEKKTRGKGLRVAGVLAPVLAYPIARLNAEFLRSWLIEESKTRANNARQGFESLRAFWKWAAKHPKYKELVSDAKLFEDAELLKAKPKRQAASAKDVLEKSHLAEWFKAVEGIKSHEINVFLQVLLLSGARRNELLNLQWTHIDERTPANIWIHDKVEQEAGRYVPIGPFALWLLKSLPKRKWTDEKGKAQEVPWVFSSAEVENQRIHHDSAGAAHARALAKARVAHVSIHGLRRSYSSLSEWLEIPAGIVAQIQGHKPSATAEKHYKRRPLELLAQWHCRFEGWILEQAGIELDSGKANNGLRVFK